MTKHERNPMLAGQMSDCVVDDGAQIAPKEVIAGIVCDAHRGFPLSDSPGCGQCLRLERDSRRYRMQPRSEGFGRAQRVGFCRQNEESRLETIFCGMPVFGNTPASCQHKASVTLQENGVSLPVVSGVETVEQRAVGQVTCLAGCIGNPSDRDRILP